MSESVPKGIIDSVKTSVTDAIEFRLKSKILGTFSISWCLFNWKALYWIFFPSASLSIKYRLDTLEGLGYRDWFVPLGSLVVYPALATAFILIVIPYLAVYAELWESWLQGLRNDRKLKLKLAIDIDRHHTIVAERNEEINEMMRMKTQTENTMSQLRNHLNEEIDKTTNLENKKDELSQKNQNLSAELNKMREQEETRLRANKKESLWPAPQVFEKVNIKSNDTQQNIEGGSDAILDSESLEKIKLAVFYSMGHSKKKENPPPPGGTGG